MPRPGAQRARPYAFLLSAVILCAAFGAAVLPPAAASGARSHAAATPSPTPNPPIVINLQLIRASEQYTYNPRGLPLSVTGTAIPQADTSQRIPTKTFKYGQYGRLQNYNTGRDGNLIRLLDVPQLETLELLGGSLRTLTGISCCRALSSLVIARFAKLVDFLRSR